MTPTQATADLQEMLAEHGFGAVIHRGPSSAPMSASIRVHVVDYKPQDVVAGSGLQSGDSNVIISAAELSAQGWPSDGSQQCPKKGDWLTINGRNRIVQFAVAAPPVGGVVIRYNAVIR